jgi:hypothetical protein
MSLGATIKGAIGALASGNVFPDHAPDNHSAYPLVIWQQVGGQVVEFLDCTIGNQWNARVQVWTWARSRMEADSLAYSVRVALVGTLKATTYGGSTWEYNEVLHLYGQRTDYSVWYLP